jgi:Transcription factor WhiB
VWPGFLPDHIAPSPADRARAILLDDYTLTNAEVALRARVDRGLVKRVRYQLVSMGALPPSRVVQGRFPSLAAMPRPPRVLMQGACVGHPEPGLWTSDVPADRERAIGVCRGCHVIGACLAWSLSLPTRDHAIYAGLTARQRSRERYRRAGLPLPAHLTPEHDRARRAARRQAREAAS